MDNINLLKKYALSYLSKYDSTKKNLERILTNKVMRMKKIEKNEKNHLFKIINQIVISLESKNIINEENFSLNKITSLYRQGKSETFIKNTLIKKKVDKKIINKTLIDFEKNNPNWKIESAKKFANKKKLGRFGDIQNKEKDLAKMARAGFDYETAKKILGYD